MSNLPEIPKYKPVRPWDLFKRKEEKAPEEVADARLSICQSCPEYIKSTHQCKKCGCIMNLKVKLAMASCPLGKWMQDTPDV